MRQFAHLHLHTQYSLLDGLNKLPDVLIQAQKLGQPAIAMTDHGTMSGALEFYDEAKQVGIKPVLGCELYLNPLSRFERKARAQGGAPTHHLTVLAKNKQGYKNLCQLVSLAYQEGFYFKPRVDHELLERFHEGLIVLSGCLSSELAHLVELEDYSACKQRIEYYARLFGEDYYLEVQPHSIKEQQQLNAACVDFAKTLGIPLVATTDCHYLSRGDHFAQEVLMCISTGKHITDPTRMRHEGVALHLKSAEEMYSEFGAWAYADEALGNSLRIAELCNVEFDLNTYYMPNYEPDPGQSLVDTMAAHARAGLERRMQVIRKRNSRASDDWEKNYQERLESELRQIDAMGFAGYFLVVADFINWAKTQGIPVGPGRGSAAGSLVAYALGITEIDPLVHKCLFERFLNPDRVSLPDIDVDFCINGRDRVIRYVSERYGKDKVAQIATFGTLKAKAAIKDVGRVLGISYAETDRVAQLVPAPRQGFDYPLEEALKLEKKLKEYAEGEGRQLIELALKLEGLTRHSSTHAAGVVISDRPLTDLLPVMVDKDGNDVTQYSMKYVEKIGLLKFDFLGLKTLTVIHSALKIVEQSRGQNIDLYSVPLDDRKTFALLCSGNTVGVFQLESTGITEMTMRLKPNCFDDLVAIVALYRPGPLDAGMVDHYIERKHGREKVSYLHPAMEHTLADTYGIILYQEQIMQLARELAGYSLSEADLLRRAMGKKVPEEMAKHRDRFVNGAGKNGLNSRLASQIFDQMETFARYGFNRSHSAAYATITFQTAFLKAHFGVEFMAALMTNEMDDSDRTLKNIAECRKQRIAVLPPDINVSGLEFSVIEGKLRFGLTAVKGVGEKAVRAIMSARETGGNFLDLEDFATRVDLHSVNRRVIENLIKCGAFDGLGLTRNELSARLDDVLKFGQALQKVDDSTQISLFDRSPKQCTIPRKSSNLPEWPINQKLSFEREALGFYISGHPLEKYRAELDQMGAASVDAIKSGTSREKVSVAGVVTALKLRNTRKGDRYASFQLEDWSGALDAIAWPRVYNEIAHLLVSQDPVLVEGRAEVTDERCNLIIEKLEPLALARHRQASAGTLLLKGIDNITDRVGQLLSVFQDYRGTCPVRVTIDLEGQEVQMLLRDENQMPICVAPSDELCDKLEQIFGRPVLSFG